MASASSLQLQFLADAAHLLRESAPEASAHLMSRCIDMAIQQQPTQQQPQPQKTSILTDIQRQRICTCCGHIMIPGCDGTTLTIQSKNKAQARRNKKLRRQDPEKMDVDEKPKQPDTGVQKIYRCGFCGRETRIVLPAPAPLPKHKRNAILSGKAMAKAVQATQTMTSTNELATMPTGKTALPTAITPGTSANAGSKKRAKNRKAGLLALLDKKRESTGGLLSLDDFRKK